MNHLHIAISASQFAKRFEEAKRIAFVVVFPPCHVDAHPEIAVFIDKGIDSLESLFRLWREPEDGSLKSNGNAGSFCIVLIEPVPFP